MHRSVRYAVSTSWCPTSWRPDPNSWIGESTSARSGKRTSGLATSTARTGRDSIRTGGTTPVSPISVIPTGTRGCFKSAATTEPMTAPPSVLVFDVNETLIDIDAIAPLFEQIFGDATAIREWFGQLVMYSMTTALSGCYVDFFTLGQGMLRMLGDIHEKRITDDDLQRIKEAMLTMPAHPDVADGLSILRDNGFRL